MEVNVYATLRDVIKGRSIHIEIEPDMTVERLLQKMIAIHPALQTELFGAEGQLRPSVHVVLNGRNVRFLDGLDTPVGSDDTVRVFPPIGGGR